MVSRDDRVPKSKIPNLSTMSAHNWPLKDTVGYNLWCLVKNGVWIPVVDSVADLRYEIDYWTFLDLMGDLLHS